MPRIRAAIKHLRKSEKRRTVNRNMKTYLKKALKEMKALGKEKNKAEILKRLPGVMSAIDKAAKNNLLHKNNAARKKSALARMAAAK